MLRLACGSSAEYTPHVATMVHSVLGHRGELDVEVHYLHGPDLAQRDRRLLADMVRREGGAITLHEIAPQRIAGLPRMRFIPPTMWYRTFLPELLPGVDRVLYLDADTIAMDSLASLWEIELGEHYLAAVTNVFEPWNAGYPAALGLPGPEAYFNSGVLLMNLRLMRDEGSSQALLDYGAAARPDRVAWGDQDALNVVLGHRRLPLAPRWNCMNSVLTFPESEAIFGAEAVAAARRRPGIRHFEGPTVNKPWHFLCDHELRELYVRHRRGTPWPRFRPEGITPRNAVRRLVRAARR